MESPKICEICHQYCQIKHKKNHYNNSDEFTISDMNYIFKIAKKLNINNKNIIFEKIRQVLQQELNEFKNELISKYNLLMVDFYEKQYLQKIEKEFFFVQNYYNYLSNQTNQIKIENEKIKINLTFEQFIKEIREKKKYKKKICLHCNIYYPNIKNHNFYINKEKKIFGCKYIINNLLNSNKEMILNYITDLVKYNESYYLNTSILDLKEKIKEKINENQLSLEINNKKDLFNLLDNVKKLFILDARFKKTNNDDNYDNGNIESDLLSNNVDSNIDINEDDFLSQNNDNVKKKRTKRNLVFLDIINNKYYVQALNNLDSHKRIRHKVQKQFYKRNNIKRNKDKKKCLHSKTNSDLTLSTENSIDNANNFPYFLENKISDIFDKYILNI